MKRKLGPLPVWAWVLIAGGGVGAFVLWKKQKEREGNPEESAIPVATGQVIQPEPQTSGAGGGSVGSLEAGEAKASAEAEVLRAMMQFQSSEYEHQLSLLQGMGGQSGLGQALEAIQQIRGIENALGITPPSQTQTTQVQTSNPATGGALKQNTLAGSPRKGKQYTEGVYTSRATGQSWNAHYYSTPVPGGKGPGRNIILVGGPTSPGPSHAGSHAPAQPHLANPFPNQGPHGRYRVITYRGKHVHEYQHSFRGGTGPRRNMVVV